MQSIVTASYEQNATLAEKEHFVYLVLGEPFGTHQDAYNGPM